MSETHDDSDQLSLESLEYLKNCSAEELDAVYIGTRDTLAAEEGITFTREEFDQLINNGE